MAQPDLLRRIRLWLAVFMAGLVLSGVTAFPLRGELRGLVCLLKLAAAGRFVDGAAAVDRARADGSGRKLRRLSFSCLRYRLACVRPPGDCCRVPWTVDRSGPQPLGDYIWADRLRRGGAPCARRRGNSRHSDPVEADRLRLRDFREHPSLALPALCVVPGKRDTAAWMIGQDAELSAEVLRTP
jgi:hypothetical protein